MKKRVLSALLVVVLAIGLLAGCGSSSSASSSSATAAPAAEASSTTTETAAAPAEATYQWKMHLNGTEGELAYDMGVYFKDKVAELTNGAVEVTLYGGAQLGTTTECLEGMAAGVADIMVESVGTLAPFTDLANIDAFPYMYTSYDHFANVWASDLGDEIRTTVGEAAGFKLMGTGYRGARIVTATKRMETLEDFQGFKLRAPNLTMYMSTWQWLGATPTPLAMGETFTAIQQKTVEGQENSILDSRSYSFAELCPYWILTNHVYSSNTVIMDLNYFNSLPADIQAAVEEAANYAGEMISQDVLDREEAAKEELTAQGIEFVTVDNAAFSEAFNGFAEANFDYLADWVNAIRAMA